MKIGKILKDRRLELGLTQEEVAEKIFVSRQTISNWENQRTLPDIESLICISNFYNLSLDKLLLRGSDIVENIKRQEKIVKLKRINRLGPTLNLIALISLQIYVFKRADKVVLGLIALAILSNMVSIMYFDNQIYNLEKEKLD